MCIQLHAGHWGQAPRTVKYCYLFHSSKSSLYTAALLIITARSSLLEQLRR